mmetsp:Transcript_8166/g.14817  ORF Transcript_8166/g.14817 Transcript_8166/m.14817 type:complete len:454 (+) Transcript_8166:298-1659(+)|eukprot:CAMPEP_0182507638 /NCGR_PEP_ID=MMETSP1321-20130603/23523_1 /TAXON_ID=91990 /ORGANISM="Bolidomonas sp., Strain RCC1657" /LENGTH=453 /DNA_ID=CAMNT_0024713571 /DNA_START=279 /DNA_END=1640 /DNA_ORIENTATION=-
MSHSPTHDGAGSHAASHGSGETDVKSKGVEAYFKRTNDKHVLKIYKQLLVKAYLPKKHIHFIEDMYGSEKMPMGAVSLQTYNSIFSARSFDRYGKIKSNKLSEKEKMIADLQATFANQASAALADDEGTAGVKSKKGSAVEELKTPTWKIGYKKTEYGPPGLAPPLPYILNSEGNERFYSYDGDWKQGNMEGGGAYKFADGMQYEGSFLDNRPHGVGKATYSSGTTYEGEWMNGYLHGEGTCTYQVGTVYSGIWDRGYRHGHGKLTFKTGSYYEGDFVRGRFEGRGTYYSKDTGITYVGSFSNGYLAKTGTVYYPDGTSTVKEWPPGMEKLSFRKAISLIEDEKVQAGAQKRARYQALYAAIREAELQTYVDDVRVDIKEERREKKLEAQAEKKRLQREQREKERDRRLQSLLNADGEAIEGAEEEVKLLRLEKEEAMRGRGETPLAEEKEGL